MFKNVLMIPLVLGLATCLFAQNKSVYTEMTPEKCKTESVDAGMPGNYIGKCAGAGGYGLEVYLDDGRNSIGVILPNKKTIGLDFWNYFGNFSELGEKAEWRFKGKMPVALIVRLNVSDRDDDGGQTSYLVVSKIGPRFACVTDIVKPGRNQNLLARRLADKSATRGCKEPR